jgi:hypothetical protein
VAAVRNENQDLPLGSIRSLSQERVVQIDYAAAAPYAAIMVVLSLPLTFLLYAQSKRMAGR